MTIQLEVGKMYHDRTGKVQGPLVSRDDDDYPFGDAEDTRNWCADGRYSRTSRESNSNDLVEEVIPDADHSEPLLTQIPASQLPKGFTRGAGFGLLGISATPPTAATKDVKREIGEEAINIVTGSRRGAYGTPENNFQRIADFWNVYFKNTGRALVLTAADVSPMMRLMKEARLCETPNHRDSFVDIVGYALTGAEINLKTS
jgi:hypothetical protein